MEKFYLNQTLAGLSVAWRAAKRKGVPGNVAGQVSASRQNVKAAIIEGGLTKAAGLRCPRAESGASKQHKSNPSMPLPGVQIANFTGM